MKPSVFAHHFVQSVDEAVKLLAEFSQDDGRVLAGGQTLVPAMALRLARPSHLIDINGIAELNVLVVESGYLNIGACVRHSAFHRPVEEGPLGRLLAAVVRHIAHLPIRNRGTLCGSLANADSASEWCLVVATLDSTLVARSVRGERLIAGSEFFRGFMATALDPDEILVAARLPLLPANTRFGFEEFSRRAGDFAQAMSLAVLTVEEGTITAARIGVGAAESMPRRIAEAEALLQGQPATPESFARAADAAAHAIEPADTEPDVQTYKRELVRTVVLRALCQAASPTPATHRS